MRFLLYRECIKVVCRFTFLVLLEYVVESWLCVAALSPAFGRPSPDFGRGDTERSDVGVRARMARFPIFHTTNSVRSRKVKRNKIYQRFVSF